MKKRGKENWRNGKKRHKNAFFQVIKSNKLPTRSSLLRKINDFRWVVGVDWND